MKEYVVAVVGARGAVGGEMIRILEESSLAVADLVPMDLERHSGETVVFRGGKFSIITAKAGAFRGVDIALFSAGADASRSLARVAVAEGAVVIDNSSAWRMDPQVPLVVPEVNPQALSGHRGIIANPNCSTIQMVVALKPIHDAYCIQRVVVATYQAVSGSGQPAIDELRRQAESFARGESMVAQTYPYQIAFNVIPQIDIFLESGYTKEEMKMVNETHKILDERIRVSATAVRVPVFRSHCEAVNVETEKPFASEDILELLRTAPGVILLDNPENLAYAMPLTAAGRNDVFVSRVRRDPTLDNGLNLWIVADNLRKGAALNAVQIAETMAQRDLVNSLSPV